MQDRANEKLQFWNAWAESRLAHFNLYKEKFAETTESGDDQLDRDARLAHRYRVKSLNQFNTLQRRLDNQRAAKMKHFRWTQDYLAKEKQLKISNEFKAANMTRAQAHRLEEWKSMEFSEMQAAANRERDREVEASKQNHLHSGENNHSVFHSASLSPLMAAQATDSTPFGTVAIDNKILKIQQEKAAARERLENLDGGRWLNELENIKNTDLHISMFREWPDELVQVHSVAICAMITAQEVDEERRAAAAAHWLSEIAYRVAKDELAAQARAEVGRDQMQRPAFNRDIRRMLKRNIKK